MDPTMLEAAAQAKHDLGKYVAFSLRWLGEDATTEQLLEALRADVLTTRRSEEQKESAPELWMRLRPPLAAGLSAGALQSVDVAVARLAAACPGLADGTLTRAELEACAADARDVSRHLAALHRQIRES